MSFALVYWILMLFWIAFGLWSNWPATGTVGGFRSLGNTLLLFILLLLLGWKIFGPPVHS
jgi:hypothetical protein